MERKAVLNDKDLHSATPKLPFLEILEWIEDDPDVMMWKAPDGDREIKNGAKLVVRESQTAMFMNEGNIADIFSNGTYNLTTANIPLLTRIKGWKYGFKSPFKADVYFFSTKQFINLKWGTPAPVILRDSQFGQVRLRAFGTYNVRIVDVARFFREYAGTFPVLTASGLEHQLRDFIAPKFGEALAQSQISVMDTAGNLSKLNSLIEPLITPYFLDLGIAITQFAITSITLPEEVTEYYDKVTGMNMLGDNMDKFQRFNTAIALSKDGTQAQQGAQQGIAMGMLVNEINRVQDTPPSPPAPPTPAAPKTPPTQTTPPASPAPTAAVNNDLRTKLSHIKELFDDGLIDEQEYKQKKSELLSSL